MTIDQMNTSPHLWQLTAHPDRHICFGLPTLMQKSDPIERDCNELERAAVAKPRPLDAVSHDMMHAQAKS